MSLLHPGSWSLWQPIERLEIEHNTITSNSTASVFLKRKTNWEWKYEYYMTTNCKNICSMFTVWCFRKGGCCSMFMAVGCQSFTTVSNLWCKVDFSLRSWVICETRKPRTAQSSLCFWGQSSGKLIPPGRPFVYMVEYGHGFLAMLSKQHRDFITFAKRCARLHLLLYSGWYWRHNWSLFFESLSGRCKTLSWSRRARKVGLYVLSPPHWFYRRIFLPLTSPNGLPWFILVHLSWRPPEEQSTAQHDTS